MGLTVHHSQQTVGELGVRQVKALLETVRQRAMDLPFHSVGEIFDLKGDECDAEKQRGKMEESLFGVICGVQGSVEISRSEVQHGAHKSTYTQSLPYLPKRVIGFTVAVAPGSEPLDFTLCQYPKTVRYELKMFPWRNRTYRTGKSGWSGRGFCKTQPANHPDCGGLRNFLRAHVSVVTLLEFAQSLDGLEVEIDDEGQYGTSYYTDDWKVPNPVYTWHPAKHDIEALAKEVGEWDAMLAAGAGAFKDLLVKNGENPQDLVSIMDSRSDREQLEAKGVEAQPQIRTNLGLDA